MRRSGERSQSGCSGGGKSQAVWRNFNTESNRKEDEEEEREKSNAEHKKREGDIRHNKRLHSVVLREIHLAARGQAQG